MPGKNVTRTILQAMIINPEVGKGNKTKWGRKITKVRRSKVAKSSFNINAVETKIDDFDEWLFVAPLWAESIPKAYKDDDDESDIQYFACEECNTALKENYIVRTDCCDRDSYDVCYCLDCAMRMLNDAMNSNGKRCKKAINRRKNEMDINAIKIKFAKEYDKIRRIKNKISAIVIGAGNSR